MSVPADDDISLEPTSGFDADVVVAAAQVTAQRERIERLSDSNDADPIRPAAPAF